MIPVIPVHESSGDYDPCDESTFRTDVMDLALREWSLKANETGLELSSPQKGNSLAIT